MDVVTILKQYSSSPTEDGSFRAHTEQLDPADAESSKSQYFAATMLLEFQRECQSVVQRMLIGENRLTPCLVSRGWRFWEEPLLTESEKKAVESVYTRFLDRQTTQWKSLKQEFDKLLNKDERAGLILLSSMLDVSRQCMWQLSADLKQILASEKSQ